MEKDLHNYKGKLKDCRERVMQSSISEKNKKLLLDFERHLLLRGLSNARILKYYEILRIFCKKFSKDFNDVTREDLQITLNILVSFINVANY